MELNPYLHLITPKRILFIILGIAVLVGLASSFYTVEADEIAVVLMFGKSVRQAEPRTPLQVTIWHRKSRKGSGAKGFSKKNSVFEHSNQVSALNMIPEISVMNL